MSTFTPVPRSQTFEELAGRRWFWCPGCDTVYVGTEEATALEESDAARYHGVRCPSRSARAAPRPAQSPDRVDVIDPAAWRVPLGMAVAAGTAATVLSASLTCLGAMLFLDVLPTPMAVVGIVSVLITAAVLGFTALVLASVGSGWTR